MKKRIWITWLLAALLLMSFALAESGADSDPQALYERGMLYYDSKNVPQDYETAMQFLLPAAEAGLAEAQFQAGTLFENGRGVEQDYAQAMEWYRLSAEQGNARAQNNVGWLYAHGYSVEQDDVEAAKWYRLSAEQYNDVAQFKVGFMYENGYGVEKDIEKALEWYHRAIGQGNQDAFEGIDRQRVNDSVAGLRPELPGSVQPHTRAAPFENPIQLRRGASDAPGPVTP